MNIPKKIWFLWLQGKEDMPYLVQKCLASWQKHHPDWEINFLDENNIYEYVDIQTIFENRKTTIYRVSQSEIIRINLLNKYGGVWVDATCFCQKPLEHWIPKYLNQGFFAFHRPGYDRMLSSWFLASTKDNPLVKEYCQAVNDFWSNNKNVKMLQDRPWIHWIFLKFKIHGYLKRNPTLWHHPIILKVLKIYPYFWFFYLFEKLYHANVKVKDDWDLVPKFSADIPHKIFNTGISEPLSDEIKKEIDDKVSPVYKLTYKYDYRKITSGCMLDYLLESV